MRYFNAIDTGTKFSMLHVTSTSHGCRDTDAYILMDGDDTVYVHCLNWLLKFDLQTNSVVKFCDAPEGLATQAEIDYYRCNGKRDGNFPWDLSRDGKTLLVLNGYSNSYFEANAALISPGPVKADVNASICSACPPGSSTRYLGHRPYTETGSIDDCVCDLGYGKHADGSCIACEKGMYRGEDSGDSCLPCPYGTTETTASTSVNKCSCAWLGANFVLEPTQQQCVCDLGTEFVANVTAFTSAVWRIDQDLTQIRSCDQVCADEGMDCNFEGYDSGFDSFDAFMELVAGDTGLVFEDLDYKSFAYVEEYRPSVKYRTSPYVYKSFYVGDKARDFPFFKTLCAAVTSSSSEQRVCRCVSKNIQDQCHTCPNGKFKDSLTKKKCVDCSFGTTNGTGAI